MAKFEFAIPTLAGYYYDSVDGNIYSTKRNVVRPIKWASRSPCSPRHAQLLTTAGHKFFVNEDKIKSLIKGNPMDSVIFMHPETEDLFNKNTHTGLKTTETYIVIAIENGKLAPATDPKVHCTLSAARAEAERLAKTVPNTQFRVYKDCGTVKASGVVWE